MKITKVTYQKAFIIGPYLQEKIGIEVEIEAGDNEDTIFCIAKDQVDRWHKENNLPLYQEKGFGDLPEHQKTEITFGNGQPPTINLQWEKAEIAIEDAKCQADLDSVKARYPTLPGRLLTLFNNKRQQLSI